MTNIDDGGPAFPRSYNAADGHNGMTLRDYFAAKALQGLIASPDSNGTESSLAMYAYKYADAMLAEGSK